MQGEVPDSDRLTTAPTVISAIAGVRSYVVGGIAGNIIETHGPCDGGQHVIAHVVAVAITSSVVGNQFGMHELSVVTLRSRNGCWVLGFNQGYSIAVDVEPNARTAIVEFAVQVGDWVPATPPEKKGADASGLTRAALQPGSGMWNTADRKRPAEPAPPLVVQGVPTGDRAWSKSRASSMSPKPSLSIANARGLRRALVKGNLVEVREIAEHLRHAFAPKTDLCGSGASAAAIAPLMAGIALVLTGDYRAALEQLASVRDLEHLGLSLDWAALFWSARASIGMVEGLDDALNYTRLAAQVSRELDTEARARSTKLLAEVYVQRGEPEKVAKLLEYSRRFFESPVDNEELAALLLLQAKTLFLAGSFDDAMAMAKRAHTHRRGWVAPVRLFCRCALAVSDVSRARNFVAPLVTLRDREPEIVAMYGLFEEIQRGAIAPGPVAEFLALEESPADLASLTRLLELCQSHPGIEYFHATLGWRLLRAGDFERARAIFTRLLDWDNISDETLASTFLALGCIATINAANLNSGARLRAAVVAAPKPMQSSRPFRTLSGDVREAHPIDFTTLTPSLQKADGQRGASEPSTNPVFTGRLQHFCLPDLLEFLCAGQCSGVLVCSSVRGIGAAYFRGGKVVGALAPASPCLRDLLSSDERAMSMNFERAAAIQATSEPFLPIGTILVRQGWLSAEDLLTALKTQARDAIAELLDWVEGYFAFNPEPNSLPLGKAVEIEVQPNALMLEVFSQGNE